MNVILDLLSLPSLPEIKVISEFSGFVTDITKNLQVTFAIAELVMVLKSIISHILPPFLVKILFHIKT